MIPFAGLIGKVLVRYQLLNTQISSHSLGTSLHYKVISFPTLGVSIRSCSGCLFISCLETTHSTYCPLYVHALSRTRYLFYQPSCFIFHAFILLQITICRLNKKLSTILGKRTHEGKTQVVSWVTQTSPTTHILIFAWASSPFRVVWL